MTPRQRAGVVQGAVGALSFLVLAQAARLAGATLPGLLVLLPVALGVGAAAGAVTHGAARLKRRV